jgi:hypothetical protein
MEGGAGSGKAAALAVLSSNEDPAPPTSEAPARVAAPLRKSRRSTKLFLEETGSFSPGMVNDPTFLGRIPELLFLVHQQKSFAIPSVK